MEVLSIFDAYDRRARVLPALIILLPVLCTTVVALPGIEKSPLFVAGSGAISIALIYFFAHVVRSFGALAEPRLWQSWGGAPSTRLPRWRDDTLSDALKVQLRLAVESKFGLRLPSADSEARNPGHADRMIADAFRQVKEFLRLTNEHGLWQSHNIEYGFARNLFGSRWLFVVFAIVSGLSGMLLPQSESTQVAWRCAEVNGALLLCWIPFMLLVLPSMVRHTADRYAERAWLMFTELALRNHATTR